MTMWVKRSFRSRTVCSEKKPVKKPFKPRIDNTYAISQYDNIQNLTKHILNDIMMNIL